MREPVDMPRCPWAIKFGSSLTTRCTLPTGHSGEHVGNGLSDFPYQKIHWFSGDRREFITERTDEFAWEG